MAVAAQTREVISFGPFSIIASERLLTKAGTAIDLGSRALDILIVLLARPNEVIGKNALLAQVWPDVSVDEGSLRVHMTYLRKALGDGKDGARYIATLAGRGYCFVAPISRAGGPRDTAPHQFPHAHLPNRLNRMIGRDEDVLRLSTQLATSRIVTIVGAGGVGKTTVAVAVGNHLSGAYDGAVLFVDFGMLSDPGLVASGVASMLGLAVGSGDVLPSLMAYLGEKRVLLILDTCEHLIDAVATLAASIVGATPHVRILATSREALRIDGERIYKLDALPCAPDDPEMTAATVFSFPATQLFIERAAESGVSLNIGDADARVVASICRKLDGVALALELAARRVETYGLPQTAALLDQHLTLTWQGARTAPPRQRTLQATLDWSFGLLTDPERMALRRLAVFVGNFTLDAALEVTTSTALDRSKFFGALDSLVGKSMVTTQPIGAMIRYRLLDTTRAYALEIQTDDTERAELGERHAVYYQRWLNQFGTEWPTLSTGTERAPHFAALNNVRAALEWCFGPDGNAAIGVGLAAAAVPVFLAMSLLPECHRWSEQGLLALDDADHGTAAEMHLQACLGISSLYMHGHSDAAREAVNKSLANADARGDGANSVGLRGLLHMFYYRGGEFKAAMENALRCRAIAGTVKDPAAVALAHSILARSQHIAGEHDAARSSIEASLALTPPMAQRVSTVYLSYVSNYGTEIALARTLWLQGHPDQAANCARRVLGDAERLGRPESLATIFAWATSIFLWRGDLDTAEDMIASCVSHAESWSLTPLVAMGNARRSEVAMRRGDTQGAVGQLKLSLEKVFATIQGMLTTELTISLVQGLTTLGRSTEGIATIDQAIETTKMRGDTVYLPELLRVKAALLSVDEAEDVLQQSLEVTRSQGGRSWELRAATDLASRWNAQGRSADARALLRPVYDWFTEGHDTADLKAAKRLLATLA